MGVKYVNLKLSENNEENFKIVSGMKQTLCASMLSKGCICNVSGTTKAIKLKLSRNIKEDIELNQ